MFFTSELDFKEPSTQRLSLGDQTSCSPQIHVNGLKFFTFSFALLKHDSLSTHIKSILMPGKLSLFLYMENLIDSHVLTLVSSECIHQCVGDLVSIFPVRELPDFLSGDLWPIF